MNEVFEWTGSIIGALGAALLASHGPRARWGWLCFLLANMLLIVWALKISAAGLLLQQLVFSVTSVLGLKRSGLLGVIWLKTINITGSWLVFVRSARSED